LPKEQKKQALFSKRFVSNTLFKKQKNSSENFLLKKKMLLLLFSKRKRKMRLYVEHFDLNGKTLLICFKAKLLILFQNCFLVQVSKMKEAKNKQTGSKVFFLFAKTTILLCKTIKHFFVSQLFKKNKHLFTKNNSFFLLEKLTSYVLTKKSVNIRDL
jgi:hypothetical protein